MDRLPQEALRQGNHFLLHIVVVYQRRLLNVLENTEYTVQHSQRSEEGKGNACVLLPFPLAFPIFTSFCVTIKSLNWRHLLGRGVAHSGQCWGS